jgi:hypothetical protein
MHREVPLFSVVIHRHAVIGRGCGDPVSLPGSTEAAHWTRSAAGRQHHPPRKTFQGRSPKPTMWLTGYGFPDSCIEFNFSNKILNYIVFQQIRQRAGTGFSSTGTAKVDCMSKGVILLFG